MLTKFHLHKHTCVPFISDTWAGHFNADLGYMIQKRLGLFFLHALLI